MVQRARSGQPRQAAPKMTARVRVIDRVMWFGQVTMPAGEVVEVVTTSGEERYGVR